MIMQFAVHLMEDVKSVPKTWLYTSSNWKLCHWPHLNQQNHKEEIKVMLERLSYSRTKVSTPSKEYMKKLIN